jgi:hypothetical protein
VLATEATLVASGLFTVIVFGGEWIDTMKETAQLEAYYIVCHHAFPFIPYSLFDLLSTGRESAPAHASSTSFRKNLLEGEIACGGDSILSSCSKACGPSGRIYRFKALPFSSWRLHKLTFHRTNV